MSLRTAIAGLGAIGLPVARALHGGIPGLHLTAVAAGQPDIAAPAACRKPASRSP